MMDFILYLLKVNLAILLLYGFYRLFFWKDTFFKLKRIVLLAILVFAITYPFVDIITSNYALKEVFDRGAIPIYNLPEILIANTKNSGVGVPFWNNLPNLFFILYSLVAFSLFIWAIIQVVFVFLKIKKTESIEIYNRKINKDSGLTTPFSFFKWILLDPEKYSDIELKEILLHEETHVNQWHTIDMLFSELICILCWFNPFVWLMKREIRLNLEFLADRKVLDSGCEATHYQFHLLRLSYNKTAVKITNNFNVSPLKKRISMMNKKQTSVIGIFKYTLLVPVVCMLIFAGNCIQVNAVNEITDMEAVISEKMLEVTNDSIPVSGKEEKKEPYTHVEKMPQYPGGQKAMMEYLSKNIVYPQESLKNKTQGTVVIRFVVDSDGSVKDVKVQRSKDAWLDAEAKRVVENMPKWIPGEQKGEKIAVYYNLPIRFKLNDPEPEKDK